MDLTTEGISRYKNFIINLLLLAIFGFAAFKLYSFTQDKVLSLLEKKQTEEKKNELLTNILGMEKKLIAYKNFLNKKDITTLLSTIGSIARDNKVNILSIKPLQEESFTAYLRKFPFELEVETDSYHNLGSFIASLESHPDLYVMELLDVASLRQGSEKAFFKLKANLRVVTFLYRG